MRRQDAIVLSWLAKAVAWGKKIQCRHGSAEWNDCSLGFAAQALESNSKLVEFRIIAPTEGPQ